VPPRPAAANLEAELRPKPRSRFGVTDLLGYLNGADEHSPSARRRRQVDLELPQPRVNASKAAATCLFMRLPTASSLVLPVDQYPRPTVFRRARSCRRD
jgi:hypothetical protein